MLAEQALYPWSHLSGPFWFLRQHLQFYLELLTFLGLLPPWSQILALILDFRLQNCKSSVQSDFRSYHTNSSHLSQTFCQVPNRDFVFVPNLREVDVAAMVGHCSKACAVQKWSWRPQLLSGPEIPDLER